MILGFQEAASADPVPLGIAYLLGPLLLGAALLIIWIAVRGYRGDLERNYTAGIRTPSTLASDEAWRTAHRVAAPWVIAGAMGSFIPGAVLLFRPSNGTAQVVIMIGLAVMVALVIGGGAVGSAAARDIEPR